MEELRDVFESDDGRVIVIGDNTIVQNVTQYTINAYKPIENKNLSFSSSDETISHQLAFQRPEIRLSLYPETPIYSCTNSNLAFPDRQIDHRFELLVLKNSKEVLDCNFTDPHDLSRWGIDVAVTRVDQDGNLFGGSSLGCLFTPYKKMDMRRIGKGKYGFWFRFQRKNAKYKITFTLKHYTTEKSRGGNEKKIEEVIHSFEKTVFTDLIRDANRIVIVNPNISRVGRSVVIGIRSEHDDIITSLCRLRDQGKWVKFEQKASGLLTEYHDDAQTKAVVLLEMSMGACYNNRFDAARQLIQDTLKLTEPMNGGSVFTARAHYYLAGIHRREKNFGEAEKCIEIAEQLLENIESDLDRAMLYYEKGGSLMDFIGVGARKPPERLFSMTKKNLEQCIEIFKSLEGKIYTKKHHFALLRIAMMMLDCRNKAGRLRAVSTEDIKSAEQCLNDLKIQLKVGAPRGLRVQYMMARSDECYRNGKYIEAVKTANDALSLAETCGFNTEISTLKDRVDFYQFYADRQFDDLEPWEDSNGKSCDEASTPGGDVSSSS